MAKGLPAVGLLLLAVTLLTACGETEVERGEIARLQREVLGLRLALGAANAQLDDVASGVDYAKSLLNGVEACDELEAAVADIADVQTIAER